MSESRTHSVFAWIHLKPLSDFSALQSTLAPGPPALHLGLVVLLLFVLFLGHVRAVLGDILHQTSSAHATARIRGLLHAACRPRPCARTNISGSAPARPPEAQKEPRPEPHAWRNRSLDLQKLTAPRENLKPTGLQVPAPNPRRQNSSKSTRSGTCCTILTCFDI